MVNTTALIRESITVIASTEPPLLPQVAGLVAWMFQRIGQGTQDVNGTRFPDPHQDVGQV